MLCTYCGGKTEVVNSRHQKRLNQVWRRRHCLQCGATFSTHELALYEAAWRVKTANGSLVPFLREKLFLSLYASLQHRPKAIEDATSLTNTLISLLHPLSTQGVLSRDAVIETSLTVLKNFDNAAATHYAAFHNKFND